MRKIISVLIIGLLMMAGNVFAMSITAFDTADNLAQVLVGSGVAISNVTYSGAEGASGYFTGGTAAGLGFDSGIVLTSGAAANLNGTINTCGDITTANNMLGDTYLDTLVSPDETYDATVLSFDFESTGDSVYFNYAFGSDEYNEYVGQYNDVFAFVLDGVNIATLPNGDPVSIDNVNNGANAAYYNDNDYNYGAFAFEYDGFTDMLTASVTGLTAGNTYSISLAIADVGDNLLDSGVFLQAGSFSDKPSSCTLRKNNSEVSETSFEISTVGFKISS